MNKITDKIKIWVEKIKNTRVSLPSIKMPSISTPKIKMPNFKAMLEKYEPFLNKTTAIIKKTFRLVFKLIKGILIWFGKAIKESIAQVWTLLGFFIAWLTLTGTAQQIVGIATIAATVLWLITIPLREEKEE